MMDMLKSILRMDEDQSARRVAQKYLKVVDSDYYEFESKFTCPGRQTYGV
jgi:chitin synthase